MPAATSPLPATAVRGVYVRQRLPVISRPTRSLRILGPSEWASLFTRIKAKLLAARPKIRYEAAASTAGSAELVDAQVSIRMDIGSPPASGAEDDAASPVG